jgi:hypothetical protein
MDCLLCPWPSRNYEAAALFVGLQKALPLLASPAAANESYSHPRLVTPDGVCPRFCRLILLNVHEYSFT